ncbi:hypothetical protein T484DRAFT_1970683 [Baffinella frigidus]|nr:hypothetical protein T484DRAFT_1970683 [Cryptophyta sp. CCMP2293]
MNRSLPLMRSPSWLGSDGPSPNTASAPRRSDALARLDAVQQRNAHKSQAHRSDLAVIRGCVAKAKRLQDSLVQHAPASRRIHMRAGTQEPRRPSVSLPGEHEAFTNPGRTQSFPLAALRESELAHDMLPWTMGRTRSAEPPVSTRAHGTRQPPSRQPRAPPARIAPAPEEDLQAYVQLTPNRRGHDDQPVPKLRFPSSPAPARPPPSEAAKKARAQSDMLDDALSSDDDFMEEAGVVTEFALRRQDTGWRAMGNRFGRVAS